MDSHIIQPDEDKQPLKTHPLQKQVVQSSNKNKNIIIIVVQLIILLALFWPYSNGPQPFTPIKYNQTALIQQLIEQMMYRPMSAYQIKKRPFTSKAYFAYRMFLNSQNPLFHKLQYHYYDKYYNISKYPDEIPFCIISPGRNLYQRGQYYKKYFRSLDAQNYSNYRVILIDDFSDDGTPEKIRQFLNQEMSEYFASRIKIVANTQRKYSLANKDNAIRNQCRKGQYILDIDADDSLIGRQALQLLNAMFQQHPQYWLMHTNDISFYENLLEPQISQSHQIPQQIFEEKIIRQYTFSITNPRAFRRDLYMIIDPKQLKDPETNDFWMWTSDRFIYNALLQLCGYQHTHYIDQIIYYYNRDQQFKYTQQKLKSSIKGRLQTPFKPLQELSWYSVAERDSQFHLTQQQILQQKKKAEQYYLNVLKPKLYTPEKKQIIAKYIQKMKNTPANIQNVTKVRDDCTNGDIYITNYLVENNFYLQFQVVQRFYIERQYQQKVDERALEHQLTFCILVDIQTTSEFNEYFYHLFISVAQQRYTNIKLIVTFNYNITQPQKKHMNFFIQHTYLHMYSKTYFIYNQYPKTKAQNRHYAIHHYTQSTDYIMPLPINGEIVGSYFLYLMNFLHQGKQTNATKTLVYANQIAVKYIDQQIGLKWMYGGGAKNSSYPYNINDHIVNLQQQDIWIEFYPFSFRKDLYENLDKKFICLNDQQVCKNEMTDSFLFKAALDMCQGQFEYEDTMLFYRKFQKQLIKDKKQLEVLRAINVKDYILK